MNVDMYEVAVKEYRKALKELRKEVKTYREEVRKQDRRNKTEAKRWAMTQWEE